MQKTCKLCSCRRISIEDHHYYSKHILNPTCIKKGEIYKTCARCADWKTVEFLDIDKNNHNSEEKVIVFPTCSQKGKGIKVCNDCGKILEEYEIGINENAHEYELINIVDATCTENGKKVYRCKYCNSEKLEIIKSLGHMLGDYCIAKVPTCVDEGLKEQKCNICGIVINESIIEPLGHIPEENEIPSTCTEEGSKIKKCSVCGEIISKEKIMKKRHNQINKETIIPATCLNEGKYKAYCNMCNAEIEYNIPKESHNFIPKMTSKFFHQKICTNCSTTLDSSLEGHIFEKGVCTVCNYKKEK